MHFSYKRAVKGLHSLTDVWGICVSLLDQNINHRTSSTETTLRNSVSVCREYGGAEQAHLCSQCDARLWATSTRTMKSVSTLTIVITVITVM